MRTRDSLFLIFALSFSSCKRQVAPSAPFVDPVLTVNTGGYYHGPSVTIEGQATGLTNLTVNGAAITQQGEGYRHEVNLQRGVNLLEVSGVDGFGDSWYRRAGVISGEYGDPDLTVEDAVAVRVNRSGLNALGGLVADFVVAEDLETTVMAANPLFQNDYGFGTHVTAGLTDLQFDTMQLEFDPRPGILDLQVVIPNLLVTVNAFGEAIFIDYDQDLTLAATSAVITGNIQATVDNQGQLSMTLNQPTVQLNDFSYDVSLLPSFVEDYVLVDTLRGLIEDQLVTQVEERVPSLLAGYLDGLDLSYDLEVLGKNVSVAARLQDLYADQDGIQLQTHLDVTVDAAANKQYVGFLYANSSNLSHPSRTHDMGMAVSDNLLNNVLLQVWRSGLLDLDLDSARGELEPAMLTSLGADGAARIVVDAPLPPVFVERDNQAQIQLTEFNVRIETPGGDRGEYIVASITAYIDLQLVIEGGVLKLSLEDPEFVIDVRESDWGIDPNTLSGLLSEQLPVTTLLALLGDIEFPLPTLGSFSLSNADAERDSSGVHTSIRVTL